MTVADDADVGLAVTVTDDADVGSVVGTRVGNIATGEEVLPEK